MCIRDSSEWMEAVRRRGDSWSREQDIGADRASVTAAWGMSNDPFAMLLLLAAIHPHHDEPVCAALVTSMAFFPPMHEEAEKQAVSHAGMNTSGPDRVRLLHLAQRIRGGLERLNAAERAPVEARLSDAMRVVVRSPHELARPGTSSSDC